MNKILKITYVISKWLLYIGLISFFILLEKFFIGLTSYSNNLAEIIDVILIIIGMALMMIAFFYIPLALFVFLMLWVKMKIKKLNLIYPAVYSLKNNLKWMTLLIAGGILILGLTMGLLENHNSLKVINTTDFPLRKVDIDGYGFSKRFFIDELSPNATKTFKIQHSNWWRNEGDYEITYQINGESKTIEFQENLGISVIYLD